MTQENYGDKTSGLQFDGVPSERALMATDAIQKFLTKDNATWLRDHSCAIFQALVLMAKEKING